MNSLIITWIEEGFLFSVLTMGVPSSLTILENMSLANKKDKNYSLKRLIKKSKDELIPIYRSKLEIVP